MQSPDEQLFDYIFHSIEWLDHKVNHLINFHLVFLTGLTRYMGFYPDDTNAGACDYFDMKDGLFTRYKPDGRQYLSPPHTQNFNALLRYSYDDMHQLKLSNEERRYLINKLMDYYAQHIENFGNIRSAEILEEVLS